MVQRRHLLQADGGVRVPRRFELGTMVTYCQRRCDMENQLSISTAEWKFMIGTIWAELCSLVSSTGLRYFETTEQKTIDGTVWYEPTDHLATVGLDRIVNAQGERRALCELMAQERNRFAGQSGSEAVAFAIVDDVIKLYPTPPNGQTYELVYIPQPPQLQDLDDDYVIDVVTPDGESFLLWGVAVAAKHKEGDDVSVAIREKEAARQRVYEWALERSFLQTRRTQTSSGPSYFDPADYWGR